MSALAVSGAALLWPGVAAVSGFALVVVEARFVLALASAVTLGVGATAAVAAALPLKFAPTPFFVVACLVPAAPAVALETGVFAIAAAGVAPFAPALIELATVAAGVGPPAGPEDATLVAAAV